MKFEINNASDFEKVDALKIAEFGFHEETRINVYTGQIEPFFVVEINSIEDLLGLCNHVAEKTRKHVGDLIIKHTHHRDEYPVITIYDNWVE